MKFVIFVAAFMLAALPAVAQDMTACEAAFARDAKDTVNAHTCLTLAEQKKDIALIKKWARNTIEAYQLVKAIPKPSSESEVANWQANIDYGKEVSTYAEYSLYAAALQTNNAKTIIDLADALRELNPESKYYSLISAQSMRAYLQTGNTSKALAAAEAALSSDPNNVDVLLVAANGYISQGKRFDRVVSYASRVVKAMGGSPPSGVSAEEWEAKKKDALGQAHYLSGVANYNQKKYALADKALRQALPLVEDNEQMLAATLFHLGVSNYQLGADTYNRKLILEGYNFFQKCTNINSPYQAQARQNMHAIRSQYRIQ